VDDNYLPDVLNNKKILVVPVKYLDRWKPDLQK